MESSVESDGFLEMVQDEEKGARATKPTLENNDRERQVLLADRTNIELAMLETQSTR